jgi:tetratricopeptide (TPR) repeat protein
MTFQTRSVSRRQPIGNDRTSGRTAAPGKNAQPGVKYVGDEACARCHAKITDSFKHHPMGRSLSPITADSRPEGTVTFEAQSSRGLALAPNDEQALDEYLAYAVDEKDISAAVEHAHRAVAADPWSSLFRERLAYFLLENHNHTEALRASSAATRLHPFLRFARMFTIHSLLAQGEFERADTEFALLTAIHPDQRKSLEVWYAHERRK